tara:strand:- start:3975 stop:10025 length:6051 start_codon:yes stop_codon:yes gene_type:complete
MAEIRHTFQTGKMNKDVDERIVPNGEYRDALNIQVVTSDDDDAGAAQLIPGTKQRLNASDVSAINPTISWHGEKSAFVGSIANERTNKCYFFISSPSVGLFDPNPSSASGAGVNATKIFKDMIVEYNTESKDIRPVVVDIFEVHLTASDLGTASQGNVNGYDSITVASESKRSLIRPGMEVTAVNSSGVNQLDTDFDYTQLSSKVKVKSIDGTTVYFDRTLHGALTNAVTWRFKANPVLSFHRASASTSKVITGINIIEDMLFWTDNNSEPKKINIKRSKAGTSTFDEHTKLYISNPQNPDNLKVLSAIDVGTDAQLLEEHISVIRRAPRNAPKLEMSLSTRTGSTKGSISGQHFTATEDVLDENGNTVVAQGEPFKMNHVVNDVTIIGANYYAGDVLIFTCTSDPEEPKVLRVKVEDVSGDNYDVSIISADANCLVSDTSWDVKLEQERALFELKFGRFGYRYKYQDGEYSSFSPWSEIAFLGGAFDYVPIKGYNLGMVNNLRELKVTDFIVEDELRPDDVVCVDILYKDTTSPNCYIVKTIERGRHPEWSDTSSGANSGVLNVTSEMIHRTLPSSQILRAWDNVPRVARAQEITGNRLVYGNYLQNYDVPQPIVIEQGLKIEDHPGEYVPVKSIKSIRKYKIGVVYGDKYGRETPVLGMGGLVDSTKLDSNGKLKADVDNPKKYCHKKTKLTAKQRWSSGGKFSKGYSPSNWMEYYKYYVKETTNDYYNLVMDRWYNAEDGNIWMSFQSADRNKLDDETYIVLKNAHGSQEPVLSEARYKILAIENEAPDYIKTTGKVLGNLIIPEGNGNSHIGLPTSKVIKFQGTDYANVFGQAQFKGIGWARIKGDNGLSVAFSKWVKIARMNNELETVTTVEPFGESANMVEILGGTIEYTLEVKDGVVENRPEFDGRFFVKVFKDATLKKFVMQETDDGKDFFPTYSFKFAYVASKTHNPAVSGPRAAGGGQSWESANGHGSFNSNSGDTEGQPRGANQMGRCTQWASNNAHGPTKQFWKAYGSGGFSTAWYLDQANWLGGGENDYEPGNWGGISTWNGIPNARLSFSVNQGQVYPSGGDDAQFKELMTQPGTYFRFGNDENKVIYEVKGSDTYGKRNATKAGATNVGGGSSGCGAVGGSNNKGYKQRRGFHVYFTQAGDPYAGINLDEFDPRGHMAHTGSESALIEIVEPNVTYSENIRFTEGNAIWETEPKEDVSLDLYYEATNALPMKLEHANCEWFAPKLADIEVVRPGEGTVFITFNPIVRNITRDVVAIRDKISVGIYPFRVSIGDMLKFKHDNGMVTSSKVLDHYKPIYEYSDEYAPTTTHTMTVTFNGTTAATVTSGLPGSTVFNSGNNGEGGAPWIWEIISGNSSQQVPGTFITSITGSALTLSKPVPSHSSSCTVKLVTGCYKLDPRTYLYPTELGWHNCYSFGNGLESDRIRDDFNAPVIDNGVKVSTTLDTYGEERRGSGMIWSGIYNSNSGVNELNEFNMAEAITKDLNPSYGTLQALKTRDTNVVAFCEDKVFKILANKDALYNADGSSNVTASNAVLGDAKAFVGDFGISSNPESLAVDSYRMYFTDKQRGKVLRLSQDGLTPISDVGMTSWFRKNLQPTWQLLGSFDELKGEYNVSLQHTEASKVNNGYQDTTVSFNEKSKGWVSFKSFVPQTGLSINGEYLAGAEGVVGVDGSNNDIVDVAIWSHHDETIDTNKFYGRQYTSTMDILFNDEPNTVKGFSSIKYEGTQAKVDQNLSDSQYYNLVAQKGWYVESIKTDQQEGQVNEFINKEGKWFNYILGEDTTAANYLTNLDTSEFSVQGIGVPIATSYVAPESFILTINATTTPTTNSLPVDGDYIFMEQDFVNTNNPVPGWNVVVVSSNELTFDDTYNDAPSNTESGDHFIYLNSATNNIYSSCGLLAGTTVTLSGKITQALNTNTWNNLDTSTNGSVLFRLNNDDELRVFIDQAHNSAGNSAMELNIDSSGDFSKQWTLSSDVSKFQITAGNIKATSGNPGVRISNLSLTT